MEVNQERRRQGQQGCSPIFQTRGIHAFFCGCALVLHCPLLFGADGDLPFVIGIHLYACSCRKDYLRSIRDHGHMDSTMVDDKNRAHSIRTLVFELAGGMSRSRNVHLLVIRGSHHHLSFSVGWRRNLESCRLVGIRFVCADHHPGGKFSSVW